MERIERRQIRVYGIVQGVGFRPTVDRHAHAVGITGTVANRGSYVEINAEGTPDQLDRFQYLVKEKSPERAVILKVSVRPLRDEGEGDVHKYTDFSIIESEKTSGEIFISPDIAICDTCKRELFDKRSRRYLHPFINCTCCGPRFSLLEALPYDRERTSMKKFAMCPECSREYHDPQSRFYDAQPVCCNECGPGVYLIETEPGSRNPSRNLHGRAAITRAREILCRGGIIAVKGIGGFHLACNATDEAAVERLRRLKRRPMKPFAVMAKNEETADRECQMTDAQREIMNGHQKPILLMKKRPGGRICEAVAPDIPTVGLMLPYAPVQLLLFTYDDEFQAQMPDVLVMTSGNAQGAPIASTDEEALGEIAGFCDAILSNNRDIRIRTDDSVMDFYGGEPYMIRRSRGYAPLPFLVSSPDQEETGRGQESRKEVQAGRGQESRKEVQAGSGQESRKEVRMTDTLFHGNVLGIGGELKNTFCLAKDSIFYPSAYVGDLADLRTVRALEDAVSKTETLLEMKPDLVVADLHPRYNSGLAAEKLASQRQIPLLRIQHHYAHVLSCMAENDCTQKVIGVSFDGTGFGSDGTIWGGEFLLSDTGGFTRCGHIRPFWQIGGDLSSREGWRIAVSMIHGLYGWPDGNGSSPGRLSSDEIIEHLGLCDRQAARVQKALYDRKMNAVQSTSAGRLFDAVAAILGIRRASTYEGEAATALMYRAMEGRRMMPCAAEGHKGERPPSCDVLPTDLLVRELIEAKLSGEDSRVLSYRFHAELARMIVEETAEISRRTGVRTAALTGGVFQNRLLLEMVEKGLEEAHVQVIRHHLVPPNDGGIGLGQALYGMRYLQTHGKD